MTKGSLENLPHSQNPYKLGDVLVVDMAFVDREGVDWFTPHRANPATKFTVIRLNPVAVFGANVDVEWIDNSGQKRKEAFYTFVFDLYVSPRDPNKTLDKLPPIVGPTEDEVERLRRGVAAIWNEKGGMFIR